MRLGWVPRGDTAVPLATSQRSLGCVSGECWGLCPPSTGLAPGLWRGTQEHLGRESLMRRLRPRGLPPVTVVERSAFKLGPAVHPGLAHGLWQ